MNLSQGSAYLAEHKPAKGKGKALGNVIDMASFEHLRRSNASERYTCPKTEVTLPIIYKVVTPEAGFVDEVVTFTGAFTTSHKLKAPSDDGEPIFPGFPPTTATQISTLESTDEVFLDVIHFENKERAKGFRDACAHLGIEPEHVSSFKDSQGFSLAN
ncbi:hypothetical protein [Pseudomonas sp. M30-35]|uniref:hypothetical protein n=1 Tax=Pseudomonas sp. M30-35 TaxID=1981174 RepID=UPI000B3CD090|nr:hypothetical protein [Pseudomonas sp. M30-35]ARU87465.1 hypothetical protein B9K09_05540 [Pseudomonas sp. M30-35]